MTITSKVQPRLVDIEKSRRTNKTAKTKQIFPVMPFELRDIKRCYRMSKVIEAEKGFYIVPTSKFQGNELFFIPKTLPIKDKERRIPHDLLASIPQDIILEIIKAFDIGEVLDDTYNIQARFVKYSPDAIMLPGLPQSMSVVELVNPKEASHIQLTGSKDVYYGRGDVACPPSPIEDRLDFISTCHFAEPEPTQGYLYLEWLIPCDYHTDKIRYEWAESCPYFA